MDFFMHNLQPILFCINISIYLFLNWLNFWMHEQSQAKKLRAERLLAKIEASMVPSGPDYDQETITDEERAMFRRVGLRMKAFLPVGE